MILMIDNFDSFTFNLVQYVMHIGHEIKVYRNNALTISKIRKLNPSHILISPGPGRPENAGISMEIIRKLKGIYPILGVCLGHQCIGEAFGGKTIFAKEVMHGKISKIIHQGEGIFKSIKNPFKATRYHSLAIAKEGFPEELKITASTNDGEIMGVEHQLYPVYGVQFHPESILSEYGMDILKNFFNITSFKKTKYK